MTQELHCHGVKQGGGDSQMSTILYFYVVNLSTKGAGEDAPLNIRFSVYGNTYL